MLRLLALLIVVVEVADVPKLSGEDSFSVCDIEVCESIVTIVCVVVDEV